MTAKLRAAKYTSLCLLRCRLSSGMGSLSEEGCSAQSSHPSVPGHRRSDLELQNDCAYGVKQRPWTSSRRALARALHVCVDCWLLTAPCTAQPAPAAAAWQKNSSKTPPFLALLPPTLCSAQILYETMLRDLSTPFAFPQEGFGHLKAVSLCSLRFAFCPGTSSV